MKIPNGWRRGRLGEQCSIEIGGTPSRNTPEYWDASKETSNPWVSIRDLNQRIITQTAEHITDAGVKHSNVKRQPKGSVLLSFKLTIGRVAISGLPLYTNEAIAGLRSEGITHEYLYHGLQQWDLLQGVDQAIKGATLNKAKLKRIEFDFPEAKPEQTKIAEILSTVDRAIEQTEALIAKQRSIKTGLMMDLLTRGIDEHGNLRFEATHKFKDSLLGRIPVEWEVATLQSKGHTSRAHIKTGPFGSALKSEHWVEFGVPVITIGALGEGQFIGSNLLFVSEKTAQRLASYALVEGDIVFSRVADVGRSVVVTASEFGWIMSSNLMRISLDQKLINPMFSQICIGHDPRIRMQIRRLVNAGGRDVANSAVMNALTFCWPPKDEQDIIVSRLEAVSVEINNGINNRGKLLSIQTGLMQNLLTGQKRVTPLLELETTH